MPPSTWNIWPVVHAESLDNRNFAIAATSSAVPILFSGLRAARASRFSGVLISLEASGVSVNDGATQLTRMFGANSAASERVKPSTAPLADAIDA